MSSRSSRVTSLDVFRGLAVAAMIVVNNPGNWDAVYAPLVHAHWNGFTFADAVFPSFVFIVGTALPLAFARRQAGTGRADRPPGGLQVLRHIARRTAILLALGLLLNLADQIYALPDLQGVRLPGVLQRIAVAYALVAPLVLLAPVSAWSIAGVAAIAVHAWLLLAVPFAGQPSGTLTPEANLPGAIDAWLLGASHLMTPTMDPEGIVGTLSTVATMLCGALAGAWLRATSDDGRRVIGLLLGGGVALVAGLAGARWLPLNKSLWTPTFALTSAGVAAVVFAICYLVVDLLELRAWSAPFLWLGVNPLAIYFLSELSRHLLDIGLVPHESGRLGAKDAFFWRYLNPWLASLSPPRASLVFALGFTALWVGVAGVLYRRGVRVRI